MSPGRTASHQLADVLLGDDGPLSEFVASRRSVGRSWRLIAHDLRDAVRVDVTPETLRSWFPDATPKDAA